MNPEITTEPKCGWYRRRLVRGGAWVPCRIWLDQPTDPETGELMGDERLRCEVAGKERDPEEEWLRLADHPIPKAEFDYMVATSRWANKHAPDEPEANPQEKVDLLGCSLPF